MSPPIHDPNEQTMAYMLAEIRQNVTYIKTRVERMDGILTGGDNPENGLVLQVDRLKQAEARRNRLTYAAFTAACGALVTAVWNKLSGGHP